MKNPEQKYDLYKRAPDPDTTPPIQESYLREGLLDEKVIVYGYPDMEPPIVRTHEDVVREINKQLASRPLGAPAPEIRAGGVDGLITNGGGQ